MRAFARLQCVAATASNRTTYQAPMPEVADQHPAKQVDEHAGLRPRSERNAAWASRNQLLRSPGLSVAIRRQSVRP